jgi:hypothetical protein
MTEEIAALRRRMSAAMPERLAAAMNSYDGFALASPPTEAKAFAAHHAACKAALAHVELLLKLTRWATGKEEGSSEGDDLGRLIAEARGILGDDDDDDDNETEYEEGEK